MTTPVSFRTRYRHAAAEDPESRKVAPDEGQSEKHPGKTVERRNRNADREEAEDADQRHDFLDALVVQPGAPHERGQNQREQSETDQPRLRAELHIDRMPDDVLVRVEYGDAPPVSRPEAERRRVSDHSRKGLPL